MNLKKAALILMILLIIAAVAFFRIMPPRIEASLNTHVPHSPYKISNDAQTLHDTLFVADLHADSLLWRRDLLSRSELGHADLPRLQAGNVALQVFSAVTKSPSGLNNVENAADSDDITALVKVQRWPIRTWSSLYERAAYQLEKLHEFSADSDGQLRVVLSQADLREVIDARAAGNDVVGAVYLIEGAHPLEGKLQNLDRLHRDGLRIVAFTHFFDNELGGSLHGISKAGLTAFGRQVVKRADELELIIDIAHVSPQSVRDILALTERPVILSHGGLEGICDTPRNLDDELMQEVAAAGGLIGIGFWQSAVCDVSPAGIVASIRYAIDLLGVDHVALGSDYDGTVKVPFDASELAILTQTMLEQGFSEDEVRKVMGDNARSFLLEWLPAD